MIGIISDINLIIASRHVCYSTFFYCKDLAPNMLSGALYMCVESLSRSLSHLNFFRLMNSIVLSEINIQKYLLL
jgi:hypothetical protein